MRLWEVCLKHRNIRREILRVRVPGPSGLANWQRCSFFLNIMNRCVAEAHGGSSIFVSVAKAAGGFRECFSCARSARPFAARLYINTVCASLRNPVSKTRPARGSTEMPCQFFL